MLSGKLRKGGQGEEVSETQAAKRARNQRHDYGRKCRRGEVTLPGPYRTRTRSASLSLRWLAPSTRGPLDWRFSASRSDKNFKLRHYRQYTPSHGVFQRVIHKFSTAYPQACQRPYAPTYTAPLNSFRWSLRITRAALCPGAPVTPPPGCAPLPQ